jgi:thiosulfate reductase cytochrome b subunit
MSGIPSVYPAAPPAVRVTMGGVIGATTIAFLTCKVLGFIIGHMLWPFWAGMSGQPL